MNKDETAQLLLDNNLGYVADPNDINGIMEAFEKALSMNSEDIENFTKNSEFLNNSIFNKDNIMNDLLKLMN